MTNYPNNNSNNGVQPWNLPDEDASHYLRSVLASIDKSSDEWEDNSVNLFCMPEAMWPDLVDDEEFHGVDIDTDIRHLFRRAQYAIEVGDSDEVIESIAELTSLTGYVGETASIENWTPLLVNRIERRAPERLSKADLSTIELHTIRAINSLSNKLCELIAKDKRALNQIEWRQLEMIVATALNGLGFEITLTPPAKDGGKDIVATTMLAGREVVFYLEIKHWRSGKTVSDVNVYDFVELNLSDATDGGLFISTSGYSNSIYSQLTELSQQRVWLAGESKVVLLCQQFVRRRQGLWVTPSRLPDVLFNGIITFPPVM